eukprot:CAMPEP_0119051546 /NCGR_PEP_ID=MMETSP1177-20130426/73124_1 /TAXON_ID=2985 /ORGANISM="Ochromonas sp, Strain CCMP1899" /LENGTH=234 /DNA_ID=CAMNT_0007030781 /DNA_START=220 /DNA_END=924 /DNA_ORIENTATION=-
MVIGLAAAISSYGVYSAVRFVEDERVINNFKKDAFGKYISPGMKVLEIGFGAGSNLEFYPSGIQLSAIDPYTISNNKTDVIQDYMLKYKEKGINMVSLTRDKCEALPFADNSFDTIVSTLVLCSVENQEQCIDEIIRVLKVGGMFICEEHIYSRDTILGSTQELFDPAQQALADGCHLTRETDLALNNRVLESVSPDALLDKEKRMFASTVEEKIVVLGSHWPISRQLFSVYRK